MARNKLIKSTVAGAVANAISDLQELAEEIREVVDNAGNFSSTERIQTLDNTASTLEEINEPDIEEGIGKIEIEYSEILPSGRKGLSRQARCNNAINALEAAIEIVQEKSDNFSEGKGGSEENPYQDLLDALEEIKGNAEACEFPGMYG
jgi:hypothetical protein